MTYQALSEALASPQLATVTLSTAQIAALHTTGVECVPAPGVGKMLLPLGFGGKKTLNSVAFAGSGNLYLVYGTDGDINAAPFKAGSVINDAADKLFLGVPPNDGPILAVAAAENKPLCAKLQNAANPTTGVIASFTITSPGDQYEVAEEVAVNDTDGGTIIVDTIDGGGGILTAHVGAGGNCAPGAYSLAGSGGNAGAITVDTITPPAAGNGSLDLSVIYAIVDV